MDAPPLYVARAGRPDLCTSCGQTGEKGGPDQLYGPILPDFAYFRRPDEWESRIDSSTVCVMWRERGEILT